jgi:hypothetical protein
MEKIDLTGFIVEDIELVIGKDTYFIPTDPDVESYIFLLGYLQSEIGTEKYYKSLQNFIISLIVNYNKGKEIDTAKIEKELGPTAMEQFMKPYVDILIDKGVLKKVTPPQKEEEKISQPS